MKPFNVTESVAADFKSGRGEITLCEKMTDREIVSRIRLAMAVSEGAVFTIRPERQIGRSGLKGLTR